MIEGQWLDSTMVGEVMVRLSSEEGFEAAQGRAEGFTEVDPLRGYIFVNVNRRTPPYLMLRTFSIM